MTHIPIMTGYFILQTAMLSGDHVSFDHFLIELQDLRFEKVPLLFRLLKQCHRRMYFQQPIST